MTTPPPGSASSGTPPGVGATAWSAAPWRVVLPWLAGYRSGPAIFAADEFVDNAWIDSSPARTLDAANIAEFCARLADRYLRDRTDRRLSLDFPAVPSDQRIEDLPVGPGTRKLLVRNADDVDGLLLSSPIGLMAHGVVGPAMHELIETLIRQSASAAQSPDGGHADAAVDGFVASLNGRERLVLGDRVLAARPKTQSELAEIIGCSRERVTQIDRSLRNRLRILVESTPGLSDLAATIDDRTAPVADAAQLVTDVMLAGVPVGDTGAPCWRLVCAALGLRASDEWIIRGPLRAVAELTRTLVGDAAAPEGIAPVAAVAERLGLTPDAAGRWLRRTGFALLGEHAIASSASTGDLVAAVLALAGAPLDFDQLVDGLSAFPRADASIRNALVADDRIIKTDRNHYGLARWGGERYEPVHVQIGTIVDERGGAAPLDDIIATIRNRYDVSASSIRAYAGAGEFITANGIVMRRERAFRPRKSPGRTRGLFRDGDGVHWATTITAAQVRGSNFNIPSALAGLIGVGPGSSTTLESRLGPQSFMWASVQGRSGSIRRFVADLGLAVGDSVFLDFTPGGFDVRRPTAPTRTVTAEILRRIGRRPVRTSRKQLVRALAESLWLPEDSELDAVLDQLSHRKETTLLSIVEELPSTSRRGR